MHTYGPLPIIRQQAHFRFLSLSDSRAYGTLQLRSDRAGTA